MSMAAATALALTSNCANAAAATSLNELISEVKASATAETVHNREREKRFMNAYQDQAKMLSQAEAELRAQESQRQDGACGPHVTRCGDPVLSGR